MSRNRLEWLTDELDALDSLGLRRRLSERSSPQGAEIEIDGRRLVNFGSNDYLGLAADPALRAFVRATLDQFGWGSGASPLVTGRGSWHSRLESELAKFEETEAALLFPSGYAANVGVVTALAGRGDLVLSDAKNHASIIDGCRLSGARVQVYPHAAPDYVAKYLSQASGFRRRLIVTDSLFSMDGDLAPLTELAELAERHDAMLIVDEAHATGVFGESGRGVCEHLGVESHVDVRVGTLSKAFGSIGGFVVGSQTLIDWLANRARPYVFSTASPEAMAAAGIAALDVVRREPQRRRELLRRAESLRKRLIESGWTCGASASQIVPILIGDPVRTMAIMQRLREHGFHVPGIRPPTVPDGESLLRISLSWLHREAEIERLLETLRFRVHHRGTEGTENP